MVLHTDADACRPDGEAHAFPVAVALLHLQTPVDRFVESDVDDVERPACGMRGVVPPGYVVSVDHFRDALALPFRTGRIRSAEERPGEPSCRP
jgi:hypothetical protein